jgi:hypothetical protein
MAIRSCDVTGIASPWIVIIICIHTDGTKMSPEEKSHSRKLAGRRACLADDFIREPW